MYIIGVFWTGVGLDDKAARSRVGCFGRVSGVGRGHRHPPDDFARWAARLVWSSVAAR